MYQYFRTLFQWLVPEHRDEVDGEEIIGRGSDLLPRDKKGRFLKRQIPLVKFKCNACLAPVTNPINCTCGHKYCKGCMKTMFLSALKDRSLIPVHCCGPVDQTLCTTLLSKTDAAAFQLALAEIQAVNTMIWYVT